MHLFGIELMIDFHETIIINETTARCSHPRGLMVLRNTGELKKYPKRCTSNKFEPHTIMKFGSEKVMSGWDSSTLAFWYAVEIFFLLRSIALCSLLRKKIFLVWWSWKVSLFTSKRMVTLYWEDHKLICEINAIYLLSSILCFQL